MYLADKISFGVFLFVTPFNRCNTYCQKQKKTRCNTNYVPYSLYVYTSLNLYIDIHIDEIRRQINRSLWRAPFIKNEGCM